MKTKIITALFVSTLLSSISFSASPPVISKELQKTLDLFNEMAHNGAGAQVTSQSYDTEKDYKKETIKIYADSMKYEICVDPTSIAIDTPDQDMNREELTLSMIKNFERDLLLNMDDDGELSLKAKQVIQKLQELLFSPDVAAIFYNGFNPEGQDGDYSEGCMSHSFNIFQKDGTKISLNFSYTD